MRCQLAMCLMLSILLGTIKFRGRGGPVVPKRSSPRRGMPAGLKLVHIQVHSSPPWMAGRRTSTHADSAHVKLMLPLIGLRLVFYKIEKVPNTVPKMLRPALLGKYRKYLDPMSCKLRSSRVCFRYCLSSLAGWAKLNMCSRAATVANCNAALSRWLLSSRCMSQGRGWFSAPDHPAGPRRLADVG